MNVEMSDITGMMEGFDTFEDAAPKVAHLNALMTNLGGSGAAVFNSFELVMAVDPSERFEILSQRMDETGVSIDSLVNSKMPRHKMALRAIAQTMGTTVDALIKMNNEQGKTALTAAEGVGTWEDAMAAAKTPTEVFQAMIQDLLPEIKQIAMWFRESIVSVAAWSKENGEAAKTGLVTAAAIGTMGGAWTSWKAAKGVSGMSLWSKIFGPGTKTAEGAAKGIKYVTDSAGRLRYAAGSVTAEGVKVGGQFVKVTKAGADAASIFSRISSSISGAIKGMGTFGQVLGTVGKFLGKIIMPAMLLWDFIKGIWTVFQGGSIMDGLKVFAGGALETFSFGLLDAEDLDTAIEFYKPDDIQSKGMENLPSNVRDPRRQVAPAKPVEDLTILHNGQTYMADKQDDLFLRKSGAPGQTSDAQMKKAIQEGLGPALDNLARAVAEIGGAKIILDKREVGKFVTTTQGANVGKYMTGQPA